MCKARIHNWGRSLSHQAFFAVLNLLDYFLTHSLISAGGEELMPLGAHMIEDYGMYGLFIYKVVVTCVVLLILNSLNCKENFWKLLNGAFTGIILWNNVGIVLGLLFN
jgi:hypothetical protein